jgi:hypothetical protein
MTQNRPNFKGRDQKQPKMVRTVIILDFWAALDLGAGQS